jgi:hypothetical protein
VFHRNDSVYRIHGAVSLGRRAKVPTVNILHIRWDRERWKPRRKISNTQQSRHKLQQMYHIDFTISCATPSHFNHVSEANIVDNSCTYLSLEIPMRATISPNSLTPSVSLRGSGRRTRSSSAGMK